MTTMEPTATMTITTMWMMMKTTPLSMTTARMIVVMPVLQSTTDVISTMCRNKRDEENDDQDVDGHVDDAVDGRDDSVNDEDDGDDDSYGFTDDSDNDKVDINDEHYIKLSSADNNA